MNKLAESLKRLKKQAMIGLMLTGVVILTTHLMEHKSVLIESEAAITDLFTSIEEGSATGVLDVIQSIEAEDLGEPTQFDHLLKKAQDTLNHFLRGVKEKRRKKQELKLLKAVSA